MTKRIYILTILSIFLTNSFFAQKQAKITKHLNKYIEQKNKDEYSVFIFFTDKGNNIEKKNARC